MFYAFLRVHQRSVNVLLRSCKSALNRSITMDSCPAPDSTKRELSDDCEKDEATKKIKLDDKIPEGEDTAEKYVRIKTKKMAILICYCGKDYYGLQRNMDVPTIEEDVLKAMHLAGLLTKEQYEVPQTLAFQRSSRTDKGVSALKQVLSMKLPEESTSPETIAKVNSHLSEKIRMIAIKKATRSFNSKNHCDGRTYMYMTPSFAFAPLEDSVSEDYRIDASRIDELNSFLALYKGSHNFHNFTSGRKPNDPSNNRYILHFECGQPFVCDGLEFVRLRVRGQSFMMHQIRKMVALAIAKMRGLASEETLKKAWSHEKVDIPKAPGVGLLLEDIHYDGYNQRYGGDGIHEPLLWDEHAEEIAKFMENHVYPTIVKTEKTEKSMLQWMETLTLNSYDTFDPTKNHRNHPDHTKLRTENQVSCQPIQEFPEDLSVASSARAQENKEQPAKKEEPIQVQTTQEDPPSS